MAELEQQLKELIAAAEDRHRKRGIDYYNALLAIKQHPKTPNAVRQIAEKWTMAGAETFKAMSQQHMEKTMVPADEIRDAERRAKNKGLLGKTFKYRNNYSCPEKPSDYWWLYMRVLQVDEAGMLTIFQFDTDKNGKINIETREWVHNVIGGSRAIPMSEFRKAWRDLQKKIASWHP